MPVLGFNDFADVTENGRRIEPRHNRSVGISVDRGLLYINDNAFVTGCAGFSGAVLMSSGTEMFWGEGSGTGATGMQGATGADSGKQGVTGLANFTQKTDFNVGVNVPELMWNFKDEMFYGYVTGVNHWVQISSGNMKGVTGVQGATGRDGAYAGQGITGLQGVTGFRGMTGLQGSQGNTGSQGVTGIRGLTGASIVGPQGATGLIGSTGLRGMTGAQGLTGAGIQGATGLQGAQGSQGVTGLRGLTGLQGSQGSQGATGITTYAPQFPWPFNAYLNSTLSNVTGDGTYYKVIFDSNTIGSSPTTYSVHTGEYTAQVNGFYHFETMIRYGDISGISGMQIQIATSDKVFIKAIDMASGVSESFSCTTYLSAGQAAWVVVYAFGGSKILDIYGGSSSTELITTFSGYCIWSSSW